jgi:two-component system, cell cycle sensor histidine kinase and response regulator CckA
LSEGENVATARETKKILCIDDELMLAELCEERLSELGYEVIGESDAEKALRLFEERPDEFHLLIVDHFMPKVLGLEFAKKALTVRPDINVLLVTGHDGAVSEEEAREAGIKEVLAKPLTTAELDAAIKRVLSRGG